MNSIIQGSRFNLLPVKASARDLNHTIANELAPCAGPTMAAVDLWEDDVNCYLQMDVPGLESSHLSLTLADDVLTVSGTRSRDESITFVRQERWKGDFERRFRMPAGIDGDAIEASLTSGVLRVTLPKSAESRVRKIEVQ